MKNKNNNFRSVMQIMNLYVIIILLNIYKVLCCESKSTQKKLCKYINVFMKNIKSSPKYIKKQYVLL
jgi:hypothetical protein